MLLAAFFIIFYSVRSSYLPILDAIGGVTLLYIIVLAILHLRIAQQ